MNIEHLIVFPVTKFKPKLTFFKQVNGFEYHSNALITMCHGL